MRVVHCDGAQGILGIDGGYLVAKHNVIEQWNTDLQYIRDFASHPWFNDLHSLRSTEEGVLVAASGTDSVTEIAAGGATSWLWWGTEHGFDTDSFGEDRRLDHIDHRYIVYDTWLHTTHVNAAVALKSSTVLATLFHQGELIAINRATGDVQAMLHGLKRPHAVRWSGQILTVADSGAGHGFTGTITHSGHFLETDRVNLNTTWLQDWHVLDDGLCVGVDGERPAVTFVTAEGAVIRRDKFDPSWHLYEIAIQ